jgi:Fe-S-cluster-containing hydrogenase component 2
MGWTLVLDLDACSDCTECTVKCAHHWHPHNDAVAALRELAAYAVACRKCEEKACANACPTEALEAGEDGTLVRHNLRCVGCLSCVRACPFGTLFDEVISFLVGSCDLCGGEGTPPCVENCEKKALQVVEELPEEAVEVRPGFAAKGRSWVRVEPKEAART